MRGSSVARRGALFARETYRGCNTDARFDWLMLCELHAPVIGYHTGPCVLRATSMRHAALAVYILAVLAASYTYSMDFNFRFIDKEPPVATNGRVLVGHQKSRKYPPTKMDEEGLPYNDEETGQYMSIVKTMEGSEESVGLEEESEVIDEEMQIRINLWDAKKLMEEYEKKKSEKNS